MILFYTNQDVLRIVVVESVFIDKMPSLICQNILGMMMPNVIETAIVSSNHKLYLLCVYFPVESILMWGENWQLRYMKENQDGSVICAICLWRFKSIESAYPNTSGAFKKKFVAWNESQLPKRSQRKERKYQRVWFISDLIKQNGYVVEGIAQPNNISQDIVDNIPMLLEMSLHLLVGLLLQHGPSAMGER